MGHDSIGGIEGLAV